MNFSTKLGPNTHSIQYLTRTHIRSCIYTYIDLSSLCNNGISFFARIISRVDQPERILKAIDLSSYAFKSFIHYVKDEQTHKKIIWSGSFCRHCCWCQFSLYFFIESSFDWKKAMLQIKDCQLHQPTGYYFFSLYIFCHSLPNIQRNVLCSWVPRIWKNIFHVHLTMSREIFRIFNYLGCALQLCGNYNWICLFPLLPSENKQTAQ